MESPCGPLFLAYGYSFRRDVVESPHLGSPVSVTRRLGARAVRVAIEVTTWIAMVRGGALCRRVLSVFAQPDLRTVNR